MPEEKFIPLLQLRTYNPGYKFYYLWISFSCQMCELFRKLFLRPLDYPFIFFTSSLLTLVPIILVHFSKKSKTPSFFVSLSTSLVQVLNIVGTVRVFDCCSRVCLLAKKSLHLKSANAYSSLQASKMNNPRLAVIDLRHLRSLEDGSKVLAHLKKRHHQAKWANYQAHSELSTCPNSLYYRLVLYYDDEDAD